MSQAARRLLRELLIAGPEGVPRSRVPCTCEGLVNELVTCGAVRKHTASRGVLIRIVDKSAFQACADRHFPMGLDDPIGSIDSRASAVLLTGDAKAASRCDCEGLFVRSTRPGTVVHSVDGLLSVPVAELTKDAGGAALLLDDDHAWRLQGRVAVIENAEAFWRHDRVLDVDLAVYAAGRMSSQRFLEWFASTPMTECSIVHWGDYDPVGTAEYLRLKTACPGRVEMYVPERLDELLARYGKRDLITKQVDVLHRVRHFAHDPAVDRLIRLWDRHQRGLEQELLLHLSDNSSDARDDACD